MFHYVKMLAVSAALIGVSFALSSCSSQQSSPTVVALCKLDANAPAAVSAGGQIAVAINPSDAGAVAVLTLADQLAHPIVQQACSSVGGVPASVVVAAAAQ